MVPGEGGLDGQRYLDVEERAGGEDGQGVGEAGRQVDQAGPQRDGLLGLDLPGPELAQTERGQLGQGGGDQGGQEGGQPGPGARSRHGAAGGGGEDSPAQLETELDQRGGAGLAEDEVKPREIIKLPAQSGGVRGETQTHLRESLNSPA